jgi:hypothetical protein
MVGLNSASVGDQDEDNSSALPTTSEAAVRPQDKEKDNRALSSEPTLNRPLWGRSNNTRLNDILFSIG